MAKKTNLLSEQSLCSHRGQFIKKEFLREVKAAGDFSGRWNYESEEKALGCRRRTVYQAWDRNDRCIHSHGTGRAPRPAAPGSVCETCHPLRLHVFLGCCCHFGQHGSPLGSPCAAFGRLEQSGFVLLRLFFPIFQGHPLGTLLRSSG